MNTLCSGFGEYKLQRYPHDTKDTLRAWDAADELILAELLHRQLPSCPEQRVLLVNDGFGALACSLHANHPHSWGDSWLSHRACELNFSGNELASTYRFIPSTESLSGRYALVLIKVPKSLAFLEEQLIRLSAHIDKNTVIIAAGMSKYIHKSTLALFEKTIGSSKTSLAKKKARLIFPMLEQTEKQLSPYPVSYLDPLVGHELINEANVFSRERLDIGSRFLIQQLHKLPSSRHIADLGCGNGVLGIVAKSFQPDCQLSFFDESYLAIQSASINYQRIIGNCSAAHFFCGDSLASAELDDLDCVLCNPPFHQQHTISDHIAWEMIKQSRDALIAGGVLWVVANRHLGHERKMSKLFGNSNIIAANNKFVLIASAKPQ